MLAYTGDQTKKKHKINVTMELSNRIQRVFNLLTNDGKTVNIEFIVMLITHEKKILTYGIHGLNCYISNKLIFLDIQCLTSYNIYLLYTYRYCIYMFLTMVLMT